MLVDVEPRMVAPPSSASTATDRFHALDALRAVALLLGIMLHAGVAYIPGPGVHWAIQDRSANMAFGGWILILHSFRLEVFFLLAGFFARLLFLRRGAGGFLSNRLLRLLVPFVGGWFLVYPGLAFAWIWGAAKGDPAAIGSAWHQALGAVQRALHGLARLGSPQGYFPLTHLWFLYYLLVVYASFFAVRGLVIWVLGWREGWREWTERETGALVRSRWLIVVASVVTWGILIQMRTWSVDTPDSTFRPHIPAVLLFGLFFSLGWFLHRDTNLLEVFRRRWWSHLLMALALVTPVFILSAYERQPAAPHFQEIRWAFFLVYALQMWSWVLASLGLFLRFFQKESGAWRYLSDSSFWLYIIHLPVVTVLQVALAPISLSCWSKFGLILAMSLLLCLASYQYLVRWTFLGWVLNGRRCPFAWLPRTR
jgi:glucans biosynthesis protein C